jgi:hypothetical protein
MREVAQRGNTLVNGLGDTPCGSGIIVFQHPFHGLFDELGRLLAGASSIVLKAGFLVRRKMDFHEILSLLVSRIGAITATS